MALRPILKWRPYHHKNGGEEEKEGNGNKENGNNQPLLVAISPDSKFCAIACTSKAVECYSISKKEEYDTAPDFRLEMPLEDPPQDSEPQPTEISCLRWVSNEHLAIGFRTGLLRVFDTAGEECFVVRFHRAPIIKIKTYPNHPISQYEADVWVLFEDAVIVSVPYYCIALRDAPADEDSVSSEPTDQLTFAKYTLISQEEVEDFALFGRQPKLLEVHGRRDSCFLITCGARPTLTYYSLGDEGVYRGLGQIVSLVKKKITTAVVGTVGALLPFSYFRSPKKEEDPYRPQLRKAPPNVSLEAYSCLEDDRRWCKSMEIDPGGRLVACTDGFGRVLVIDLWTQIVVRLFKGHRDAQCGWMEVPEQWSGQLEGASMPKDSTSTVESVGLYLVIYSPRRGDIEIWRMRHGTLVKALRVGNDVALMTVNSTRVSQKGSWQLTKCYIVKRRRNGGDEEVYWSRLELGEGDLDGIIKRRACVNKHEDSYYLQHFRNMLVQVDQIQKMGGEGKPVKASSQESEQALLDVLSKIKAPNCVSQVMDLIDDESSGAQNFGASFHKQATLLCQDGRITQEDDMSRSQYYGLSDRLKVRSRLVSIYESLHEVKPDILIGPDPDGEGQIDDERQEEKDGKAKGKEKKRCLHEAESWARVSRKLRGREVGLEAGAEAPMTIPGFINCFSNSHDQSAGLVLSDSMEPLRKQCFLRFLMRPFLADVFALKTLEDVCEKIGWESQDVLGMFAEWFLGLPIWVASKITLINEVASSPVLRWLSNHLNEMASAQIHPESKKLDSEMEEIQCLDLDNLLDPIFRQCYETTRLEHAFLLCAVCIDLIMSTADHLEEKSYGRISSQGAGERWKRLLRQIRIALLITYRLNLRGSNRESVSNLDTGSSSMYGILASDLLSFSTSPAEVKRLTLTCSSQQHKRYGMRREIITQLLQEEGLEAFSEVADEHWKIVQDAALSDAIKLSSGGPATTPSNPIGGSKHKKGGSAGGAMVRPANLIRIPLLTFFTWHNQGKILACHRAKCLVSVWKSDTRRTNTFSLASQHLADILTDDPGLCAAVAMELWLSVLAPRLNKFFVSLGKKGIEIQGGLKGEHVEDLLPEFLAERATAEVFLGASLGMLQYMGKGLEGWEASRKQPTTGTRSMVSLGLPEPIGEIWPITEDRWTFEILLRLEVKPMTDYGIRQQGTLLKLLHVMLAARMWSTLPPELFMEGDEILCTESCLWMTPKGEKDDGSIMEKRRRFLIDALKRMGVESVNIVYRLAEAFEVPVDVLRREHVLMLLRLSQDVRAEETMVLVENVDLMAQGALQIIRGRLAKLVTELQKDRKHAKLLAAIDADTCQWVMSGEKAGEEEGGEKPSLAGTHNVLLKLITLLSVGSANYKQAQALSGLTSTLLKALQA